MAPRYSICTTCYRSAPLVEDFINPLLGLGDLYEIVVVDNNSDDGTFGKIKEYRGRVIAIRQKCTRGKGRQIAIDNSKGEVIINVEFDVGYLGISKAVDFFEKTDKSKIYYFIIIGQKCNASLYIGRKELFNKVGGFPDLNYAEDLYLNKKARNMGLFETVSIDLPITCFDVKGMSSGHESRYEKSKIMQIKRRIIATRDILFVNGIGYHDLMIKYNLKGTKALLIGLPEYLFGKLLRFTIKEPVIDE